MPETDDYQRGYLAAETRIREDLALTLRAFGVDTGEDDAEVLSDSMVRDIFSGVFSVQAAYSEFGPEPSGKGVRALIGFDT